MNSGSNASECRVSLVVLFVYCSVCFWGPRVCPAQDKPTPNAASVGEQPQQKDVSSNKGSAESEQSRRAEGVVVDGNGLAIDDCIMICHVKNRSGEVQKLTTRTDGQGRFALVFPADVPPSVALQTYLFKPGYALRIVDFGYELHTTRVWQDVKVVLNQATPIKLRVLDPRGLPIKDATVEPLLHWKPNGSFSSDTQQGVIGHTPAEVRDLTRVVTNAAGEVECNCFDPNLLVSLCVSNEQFGSQIFRSQNKTSLNPQFVETASIRGRIVAANPRQFAGSKLLVETWTRGSRTTDAPASALARVTIDSEGNFEIPALGAGRLFIEVVDWPYKSVAQPVLSTLQVISAGVEHEVQIATIPSVPVSGRILKSDQTPAADVGVSARSVDGWGGDYCTTDDNGRYQLYVRPGKCTLSVAPLKGEIALLFKAPEDTPFEIAEGTTAPVQLDPIALQDYPRTRLHFSDESHRPHANTSILLGYQLRSDYSLNKLLHTDGFGRLTLPFTFDRELDTKDCPIKFYLSNEINQDQPDVTKAFKIVRRTANELWLERDSASTSQQ